MKQNKYVFKGKLGIINNGGSLSAGFDTCSGIVLYNNGGLRGLAHASLPSGSYQGFTPGSIEFMRQSPGELITPTEATEALLEEMLKQGADKSGLRAMLFGCKPDGFIGVGNEFESRRIIKNLGIPLIEDYSGRPANQDIFLTQEGIDLFLEYPDNCKEERIRVDYTF